MESSTSEPSDSTQTSTDSSGIDKPHFATVVAEVNALGRGRVFVNDDEIGEYLTGFSFEARVGEVPHFFLTGPTVATRIKGEGIVVVSSEPIPVSILVRSLNAQAIETEALSRMEWGDDRSLTQHILDVIAEAAEEAENGGN